MFVGMNSFKAGSRDGNKEVIKSRLSSKGKNMYLDFVTLIRNNFCDSQREIVCKSRLRKAMSAGQLAG